MRTKSLGAQTLKVSKGNKKIGNDTLIINITSATDCPSKKLGLCKHPGKCYAMKAERQYPACLPYRRSQTEVFDSMRVNDIVAEFRRLIKASKTPVKYIRYSESGDFRSQQDVDKLSMIARHLHSDGVTMYGYTARRDLDFTKAWMVVNGSGFMVHNEFKAVTDPQSGNTCPGNCRDCNKCKVRSGQTIEVKYH